MRLYPLLLTIAFSGVSASAEIPPPLKKIWDVYHDGQMAPDAPVPPLELQGYISKIAKVSDARRVDVDENVTNNAPAGASIYMAILNWPGIDRFLFTAISKARGEQRATLERLRASGYRLGVLYLYRDRDGELRAGLIATDGTIEHALYGPLPGVMRNAGLGSTQ